MNLPWVSLTLLLVWPEAVRWVTGFTGPPPPPCLELRSTGSCETCRQTVWAPSAPFPSGQQAGHCSPSFPVSAALPVPAPTAVPRPHPFTTATHSKSCLLPSARGPRSLQLRLLLPDPTVTAAPRTPRVQPQSSPWHEPGSAAEHMAWSSGFSPKAYSHTRPTSHTACWGPAPHKSLGAPGCRQQHHKQKEEAGRGAWPYCAPAWKGRLSLPTGHGPKSSLEPGLAARRLGIRSVCLVRATLCGKPDRHPQRQVAMGTPG